MSQKRLVRYLGMDAEEVTFTHHRLETFAESENTEGQMILVPLDALGTEIVIVERKVLLTKCMNRPGAALLEDEKVTEFHFGSSGEKKSCLPG